MRWPVFDRCILRRAGVDVDYRSPGKFQFRRLNERIDHVVPQHYRKRSGGHHHGHGGLFKKIESAVTTALDAAKSDPSADPNKVVQDAIAKVFQDNGGAPPADAGGANGGPQSTSDADGDQHAARQGNGAVDSARQAFTQTLQSFGVDPNQFHTDFLAAIQQVQSGGTSDSSSDLFKTFPPGSSVDTTA
jgi:hypothetical protein